MGLCKVTFLGSGDAFGHGGRLMPCILVEAAGRRMLWDCGASAMISLNRYGVEPNSIDAILISHLHGDHFGGLPYFILDAQLHSKRQKPLLLAGPRGTAERLLQAMEVNFPGSRQVARRFGVETMALEPGQAWAWGELHIEAAEILHPSGAPALALRMRAGDKLIAYTGDGQWADDLLPFLQGADLLIAEAYFFEKAVKFHLSYRDLSTRLAELRPGRLALTHMGPDMLARLPELDVQAAEDGLQIEV